MTATVREEIRSWVEERQSDIEQDGALSAIAVLHLDGHGQEKEVHLIKVGHDKWGKPDEMALSLYNAAARHSRGLVGQQQFNMIAVYGTSKTPARSLPFGLSGALQFGSVAGGGMSTEPPTAVGSMQQSMRLTELIVQGAMGDRQHVARTQQEIIDGLRAENLAIKKEWAELWIACKDLLLELNKQRHDVRMQELAAARAAEFQKQVMALAPALINMMAGKDIFPLLAADTALLDGIAGIVKPEQVQTIIGLLQAQGSEGQLLASTLNSRYDSYHKRQMTVKTEEDRLMRMAPGRSYDEGEEDAAGEALRALKGHRTISAPTPLEPKALVEGRPHVENVDSVGGGVSTSSDTELLDKLIARVPPGMIDVMTGTLAGEDPELAQQLKARFTATKK